MRSKHMPSRMVLALVAAAIGAAATLAACQQAVPPVPADAVQPDFKIEPVSKRVMPVQKRNVSLPAGLPVEIPVIDGSVVSTSADVGTKTWMYTLDTTGPVAAVAYWYDRTYVNAQWISDETTSTPRKAEIIFKKHGARTRLTIEALKSDRVRVHASIGLGQIPAGTY